MKKETVSKLQSKVRNLKLYNNFLRSYIKDLEFEIMLLKDNIKDLEGYVNRSLDLEFKVENLNGNV